MKVPVQRKKQRFYPDPKRVIARYHYTNGERSKGIIKEILAKTDQEVSLALSQMLRDYSKRHRNITRICEKHFNNIENLFKELNIDPASVDLNRKVLIGSFFTLEYSIESAAFFNPSIVEHPDQSELLPGELRVILSFRATGEGHISSIVFREGVLDKHNNLRMEEVGHMLAEAESVKRFVYNKDIFIRKLDEMQQFANKVSPTFVLDKLPENFTYGELLRAAEEVKSQHELTDTRIKTIDQMIWLASSHYELDFSLDSAISERVIFPVSEMERNGIEDARFVRFVDDDGSVTYYATYTAYDGTSILPKLIETKDFYHFKILPIHGEIAQNKGMALFPRKINGKYAMLCRNDGFKNYIAFSDHINIWREATVLQEPKYAWEFVKIGNCGSPIETEFGWLIITHGVGPMREYSISAAFADLDDPSKLIARCKTPLISPNSEEREGYVPNVVYSCGSIIHNDELIIPYGLSDFASTYAVINLNDLLIELKEKEY